MSKLQKELFEEWEDVCTRIKRLNSVVQNDMDRMLLDGLITKQDIINEKELFRSRLNGHLQHLQEVTDKIVIFLDDKSK